MKKQFFLVLLVIMAVGVLLFTGSVPATQAKVIELKFATFIPPAASQVKLYEQWGREVEKLTNGRVKVTMYAGGSLVKYPDMFPAVLSGIADITTSFASSVPEFTLERLYNLPMLGWTSGNMLEIRKKLETEFPAMVKGRSQVKTLFHNQVPLYTTHLSKKVDVRVPDDIKGLKFRSTKALEPFVKACGAVPVFLGPPDWYMSLEKGVINGIFLSYSVVGSERLDEVTKTHLNVHVGTSVSATVMNLDKWNKLPADLQKIIEGTLESWEKKFHADALAEDKAVREKLLASSDHKVIDPTAAELALWTAKARPSHQVWIKKMKAKGLPAQAAYDKLMEIIAGY